MGDRPAAHPTGLRYGNRHVTGVDTLGGLEAALGGLEAALGGLETALGGFETRPYDVVIPFHNRRSARVKAHDYTLAGAYFITICTAERACIFGDVDGGEMRLNDSGHAVQKTWDGLPDHYHRVELDAFVVMPNHIHGILVLAGEPSPHGLSEIVRGFKTFSARGVNNIRNARNVAVWQRSYHDHVVRDDADLDRLRRYIADNPAGWANDAERLHNNSDTTT